MCRVGDKDLVYFHVAIQLSEYICEDAVFSPISIFGFFVENVGGYRNVGLYMDLQFYSVDHCVCFCARAMLCCLCCYDSGV